MFWNFFIAYLLQIALSLIIFYREYYFTENYFVKLSTKHWLTWQIVTTWSRSRMISPYCLVLFLVRKHCQSPKITKVNTTNINRLLYITSLSWSKAYEAMTVAYHILYIYILSLWKSSDPLHSQFIYIFRDHNQWRIYCSCTPGYILYIAQLLRELCVIGDSQIYSLL